MKERALPHLENFLQAAITFRDVRDQGLGVLLPE